MTNVELECDLNVSADDAWLVLADFGAFLDWAGGPGATAKIEGEGPGMVRLLKIPELGTIGERLDSIDTNNKVLCYSLVEGQPLGMEIYSATVRLVGINATSCKMQWRGEFEPAPGHAAEEVATNLSSSYQGMSAALEAHIKAK